MKETCYRVKMIGCRVETNGFRRMRKKKRFERGILRMKKQVSRVEKEG